MPHVVLIVNPAATALQGTGAPALAAEIARQITLRAAYTVEALETDPRDGGAGAARDAVLGGADLVVVAGGDATVRTIAEALAGSGVPLGVVPCGASNLMARSLGLTFDVTEAVRAALDGDELPLDLGRLDDGAGTFAVMAGLGSDAAVLDVTIEALTAPGGWPTAVLPEASTSRRRPFDVEISLDGQPAIRRRAVSVLVGNAGRLRREGALLPDAADGLLEVCVLAPLSAGARLAGLTRVGRRPTGVGEARWERWPARKVLIRAAERQPRQLDGQAIASSSALDASLVPGGVVVRVPGGHGRQRQDLVDLSSHARPAGAATAAPDGTGAVPGAPTGRSSSPEGTLPA